MPLYRQSTRALDKALHLILLSIQLHTQIQAHNGTRSTMDCIEVSGALRCFKTDPLKLIFRYQRQFIVWKTYKNVDRKGPEATNLSLCNFFWAGEKTKSLIGVRCFTFKTWKIGYYGVFRREMEWNENSLTIDSTTLAGELASTVFERWWDDDMTRFKRSRLRFRRGWRQSVNSLSV